MLEKIFNLIRGRNTAKVICSRAEIFIPENWESIRKEKGLKLYSEEEHFYIHAFFQYRDLFLEYPRAALFIGKPIRKNRSRLVEIFHDLPECCLAYCEFTLVKDEETLRRINAYHNWRDKDSKPIRYTVGHSLPRGVYPIAKFRVLDEAPDKRIFFAVDAELTDRLVIPHLRDTLDYREIQKYIVK